MGDRLETSGFSRGLVLCIAYAIRLLEANEAKASKQEAEPSQEPNWGPCTTNGHANCSTEDVPAHNVLHQAYGLIAQACEEAAAEFQAAMTMLSTRETITLPWELDMADRLQAAIND